MEFEDTDTLIDRYTTVPEQLKKWAWLGYSAFFFFMLVFFIFLTFPYQASKKQIENQINQGLPSHLSIEINKLRYAFPLGVKISDIKVINVKQRTELIRISKAKLKLPIHALPFLPMKRITLSYWFQLYGGSISGSLKLQPNSTSAANLILSGLDVSIKSITLSRIIPQAKSYGIMLKGELKGALSIKNKNGPLQQGSGTLKLRLSNAGLKPSNILGFFQLPAITFKNAKAELIIDKGIVHIREEDLLIQGDKLNLSATGTVHFMQNIRYSRIDSKIQIRPSKSLDKIFMDSMQKNFNFIVPIIKKSKDIQGNYGININGTLSKPRASPTRN